MMELSQTANDIIAIIAVVWMILVVSFLIWHTKP